jgi:hypothetical protein
VYAETQCTYTLIALDPGSPRYIIHESPFGPPTMHETPFTDLSPIVSHIKPYFAIYDCGRKIHNRDMTEVVEQGLITKDTIRAITRLYTSWIETPPASFLSPTVGDPELPESSEAPQPGKHGHEGADPPAKKQKSHGDSGDDQDGKSCSSSFQREDYDDDHQEGGSEQAQTFAKGLAGLGSQEFEATITSWASSSTIVDSSEGWDTWVDEMLDRKNASFAHMDVDHEDLHPTDISSNFCSL